MPLLAKRVMLRILFLMLLGIVLLSAKFIFFQNKINYNADVKPILNKHCISCHGGVKQSGGFSLMTRNDALQTNDSGHPAIAPKNASGSELIKRIKSADPEERMPLDGSALSSDEIKILGKWIDQGAEWGLHWAYHPIQNPFNKKSQFSLFDKPKTENPIDQIDQFVTSKLAEAGLKQRAEANQAELLRRVSFDIIGIPAPVKLQEKYLHKDLGYEGLVDSLLTHQGFGEKWASMWLDIARYADSKGFERDASRTIWPFRDYVIRSLNQDKAYDQFVLEQLAGDMLDNPSEDQYLATGFHRNTTTNDEGGTNNEEFRVKAVMDRVAATWEGLMGTTMACVQCHGHPYDPFSHQDYYATYAIFNNTRDADTHMDYPRYKLLNKTQQLRLDSLTGLLAGNIPSERIAEIVRFIKTGQPVIYSIETDNLTNAALYDTKYLGLRNQGHARLKQINLNGKDKLIIKFQYYDPKGVFSLHLNSPDGLEIGRINLTTIRSHHGFLEVPLTITEGIHDIYLKYTGPSNLPDGKVGIQFDWFHFTKKIPHDTYQNLYYSLLKPQQNHSLIMIENPPDLKRETFLFDRGNWQAKTTPISPGIPDIWQNQTENKVTDRLTFAKWVTSKNNPLTARTMVNRVWEQLFGQGIVLTTEDLGSQGAIPSHQELLDYVAYYWMHRQDWKLKELIKTIVMTKTYRQSARSTPDILEKDPYNRLLSRGARVRLSAEQIRDQALAMSGLLSEKMFGPPAMPYQPKGIWQTPYNPERWVTSNGEDAHRRSVYTFIKRSSVYPSMETFDGAQRQVCTSRRIRTNTPLQALVTLNDPVFVEASEHLAQRMKTEGGKYIGDQIDYAYRLAMSQPISEDKKKVLTELFQQTIQEITKEKKKDDSVIALSTVASAIINLDELLNK